MADLVTNVKLCSTNVTPDGQYPGLTERRQLRIGISDRQHEPGQFYLADHHGGVSLPEQADDRQGLLAYQREEELVTRSGEQDQAQLVADNCRLRIAMKLAGGGADVGCSNGDRRIAGL